KLQSNHLLYSIWLDFRKREQQACQEGKPFAYCSGGIVPTRLLTAMGLYPLILPTIGDRAGSELAEKAFRTIWARGFPDPGCDRTLVPIGMAINGDLPPPSIVIDAAGICIPETSSSLWAGLHFDCPRFCFDIPYEHSWEGLQYLVRQIQEMIDFIKREVPGTEYDENKLIEFQNIAKREHPIYREIHKLKSTIPCPLSPTDSFRMPAYEIIDDPRTLQYAEMYREELRERVKIGFSAVGQEKLRLAWLVSGPYHTNPFGLLEDKGVSVPWFEFGQAMGFYGVGGYGVYGDETEYGRQLTLMEEEARVLNHNTWGGQGCGETGGSHTSCMPRNED
ncbi:2-hydroxyacyl-CoA dehydratase, partial [Chloroflexota bacterium]